MLNLMRKGIRSETRLKISPYSKKVKLSFFHEVEDTRRAFQMDILDLSNEGLSIQIQKDDLPQFEIGDYLRIHNMDQRSVARVCYIEASPKKSFYRVGLCLKAA
jgi:hypothetical protein